MIMIVAILIILGLTGLVNTRDFDVYKLLDDWTPKSGAAPQDDLETLKTRAKGGDRQALEKVWQVYRYASPPGPETQAWLQVVATRLVSKRPEYADYLASQGQCAAAARWATSALEGAKGPPENSQLMAAARQRVALYGRGEGTLCPPHKLARSLVAQQAGRSDLRFEDVKRGYGDVVCGKADGRPFIVVNGGYLLTPDHRANQPKVCSFADDWSEYCEARPAQNWQCTGGDPGKGHAPRPDAIQQ